jgi:hypothetical protein
MRQLLFLLGILFQSLAFAQLPRPVRPGISSDYRMKIPNFSKTTPIVGIYQQQDKYGFVFPNGQRQPAIYEFLMDNDQGFIVKKNGLYGVADKHGKLIGKIEYESVASSDTEDSKLLVMRKGEKGYHFMDANYQLLLPPAVSEYGYIHDASGLLNDKNSRNLHLLYVKGMDGKVGAINEGTGKLAIPMVYDSIMQYFSGKLHDYFSVKKGEKYGVVDDRGQLVLPIQYDALSLNMIGVNLDDRQDDKVKVVVCKNGKMGAVNLKNQILIPLMYGDLQRISYSELYKAKVGKYYQLINGNNKVLNAGPFDELANFEKLGGPEAQEALSFYQGKMRPINQQGGFLKPEIEMQPHQGYKTFDELKAGLIAALDSKDDQELKRFADKVAPSEHILHFVTYNDFNRQPLGRLDVAYLRDTYFQALLNFKFDKWDAGRYDRTSLTGVKDFTGLKEGYVGNSRRDKHAFDDRFIEMLLRNAFKINGYWISTYFMHRNFGR